MSAVAEALADERPHHRWRRWMFTLVALVAAAGIAVALTRPFHRAPSASTTGNAAATSFATVSRRSLAAQTQVNGTLGYAGTYTVTGQVRGTITALPSVGQLIKQGQVLYRVDGRPVVLLYGSTPAYRDLAEGATASDVTGADVRQLNAALVALGYASSDDLDPSSDEFTWATKAGVEKLQKALGVEQTGAVALGDVVFEPTALRVTGVNATLGAPTGGAVLSATSTARQVSIDLDTDLQSAVKDGDAVTVTLPDGRTTPGHVSSVGTVAAKAQGNANASPTIAVTVALSDPRAAGSLDQAPVQVAITTDAVTNALVVPVTALLALAGGGYAVEVVGSDGRHRLIPVSLGLFDDAQGIVQVSGTGLAAGQRVVVPAS